jgi:HAD superfamily hydrolase (TIGR01549 family)
MPHGLSLPRFDAVLFDVDGTLVDSVEMIVLGLGDAFEKYLGNRPEDEQIRRLIGLPLHKQFGRFMETPPTEAQIKEMSSYTLERFEIHRHRERWFDSAIEALKLSHDHGIKTALVTSKNAEELAAFLPVFPGTPYLNASVCASDVSRPKPEPDSAILACERLGVARDKAVMVGDSVFDLRCARAAGISGIAVSYGAGLREDLLNEQPNALFDTPEELLDWAKSNFLHTSCAAKT